MNAPSAALVRSKLVALRAHIQELRTYVDVEPMTYLARPDLRRASERMIQISVECAIDIAEGLLADADLFVRSVEAWVERRIDDT